jgi:radical SAM-linked protein
MAGLPSLQPANAAAGHGAPRFRVAVEFAVLGDLRFLSHHDEVRMLTRALVRAGWPLAYSHGFNPRLRLTIPLPRNLGVAARSQVALVDLCAPRTPAELHASLAPQLPAGCRLLQVIAPAPRATPQALAATYELDLDLPTVAAVRPRIAALLARPSLLVQREYGPQKPTRPVDIRPFIERVELEGPCLRIGLRYAAQRTARPSEVTDELGLAAETCNGRFRRADVQWNIELSGSPKGPAAHERTQLDHKENDYQEEGDRDKKKWRQREAAEPPDPEVGGGGRGNRGYGPPD